MMDTFDSVDIQELPLRVPFYRRKVEDFLGRNGLRLEEVDSYLAVLDSEGAILAGGGLYRDIVKCVAVSEAARSLGLSTPLISRLISLAAGHGYTNVKVFTKPENRAIFESLGFHVLAEAPKAILMENGRGLEEYCRYLRSYRRPGRSGVVVMNANPFTCGHQYLLEQAASQVDTLYVIPVREDLSLFPYAERSEMIRQGSDAMVVDGSDYQISAATFPTYFLKDLSDAAETQMRLDIDLFGRHIAPAIGAAVRFVGSEPLDPLTARYNALMKELLPAYGVEVVEVPRLRGGEVPISASYVRDLLDQGLLYDASKLVPASTKPYLMAYLAERALCMELDAPLKPGLVCPDSTGAHRDMDYALMLRSIAAIRPFFPRMAQIGVALAVSRTDAGLADAAAELRQLGLEAEAAMLAATGGVNTHRGAIFALGLALAAAGCALPALRRALLTTDTVHYVEEREMEMSDTERVMKTYLGKFYQVICCNSLNDSDLHFTPQSHGAEAVSRFGVKGARGMAVEGYKDLFEVWLPYYRSVRPEPYGLQKTLLRIMSDLDDTCIIHRVGYDRAQEVKEEAKALLKEIPGQAGNDGRGRAGNDEVIMAELIGHLKAMNARYNAEGISPGGAADMLALTILVDSLLN